MTLYPKGMRRPRGTKDHALYWRGVCAACLNNEKPKEGGAREGSPPCSLKASVWWTVEGVNKDFMRVELHGNCPGRSIIEAKGKMLFDAAQWRDIQQTFDGNKKMTVRGLKAALRKTLSLAQLKSRFGGRTLSNFVNRFNAAASSMEDRKNWIASRQWRYSGSSSRNTLNNKVL